MNGCLFVRIISIYLFVITSHEDYCGGLTRNSKKIMKQSADKDTYIHVRTLNPAINAWNCTPVRTFRRLDFKLMKSPYTLGILHACHG